MRGGIFFTSGGVDGEFEDVLLVLAEPFESEKKLKST